MDKFVLGSVVLIMFINSVHNSLPPANKNQLDEQSSEKKNVDAVTSRNINVDENTTNVNITIIVTDHFHSIFLIL